MSNTTNVAVGCILQNLKESVQQNSELLGEVMNNVDQLSENLDMLKGFIEEHTGKKYSNNEILLTNEIRTVVCDAEDAIETYILSVSMKKLSKAGIDIHFGSYISDLRSVCIGIDMIIKELIGVYQTKTDLGFSAIQIHGNSNRDPNKKKSLVVEEGDLVGFEDAAKEVIQLLTLQNQSENLEVISIIGMLGLGKSTLAKMVLNHPEIVYEFHARAFINVSQQYNRKEVFLKILGCLTQITEEMNKMSDERLAEMLQEKLKTKKYLIVMDDILGPETWDHLKIAFPNNSNHSRVLITSRNSSVGFFASDKIKPYNLRFLLPKESRELLRMKIFGEYTFPPEFEEYENCILSRCGGFPLSISLVAGILANHRDRIEWWKKVAEDMNDVSYHREGITELIKLSYNHMPYRLKPCFLYLGVFREDTEIPVSKLLRLWIAEGFIPPQDGNTNLEDRAEECLQELVDRNFVTVGRRRSNGQIKTCRIHDILRSFCLSEAWKENLFREMKRFDDVIGSYSNSSMANFRCLCVNDFLLDYLKSKPSADHVRSFLSFAKEQITLPPQHVSTIPKAFKLLRVLDVNSIIFTRFPTDLFYMVLLKYIAISTNLNVLPVRISYLWNLQTLIVETSSPTLEIKADIWKLPHLRHLQTNVSTHLQNPPDEEESSVNTNLQTLSTISPESCNGQVFKRAPKLRKLGIRGTLERILDSNNHSNLFTYIVQLENLENLKLLNDDITFKLNSLPPDNMFPRQLTVLTLRATMLDWMHMSTLGKLKNLEVLKLKDNAFQGEYWETEDGSFCSLKVLHIGSTNLVRWNTAATHHFPKLTRLYLRHCTMLEAIPYAIGDISTLQEIDLYCTNLRLANSARRVQCMKREVQYDQDKNRKGASFKLSVYPPDYE